MDLCRRGRIKPSQQSVQIRRTVFLSSYPQALPQLLGALRSGKEPFQQRSQIKAGAADHDGNAPPNGNLLNRGPSLSRIFARGERPVRFGDIKQMMRHKRTLLAGWLGRTNFEVTIAATESQLTTSPENCSASAMASADLPEPVGPRMTTRSGSVRMGDGVINAHPRESCGQSGGTRGRE